MKIETTPDGRYFIRTAAGNVACGTSGEPFYTHTREQADLAVAYLRTPNADRKKASAWLKSTFGLEG